MIGLEREFRQKSAGLRTYTVVGLSAALIMLISKYGFANILEKDRVVLDPSRIAAQIVSGIGFIGGGVIFVRKDVVRGLTTAATVWLAAAVGMACGAGLPILALATTAGHFVVVGLFPRSSGGCRDRDGRARRCASPIGTGAASCANSWRSAPSRTSPSRDCGSPPKVGPAPLRPPGRQSAGKSEETTESAPPADKGVVTLLVELRGVKSLSKLVARLSGIDGVVDVQAGEPGDARSERRS